MDLDIPTIVADLLLAHITGAILFLALLTPPSNLSHRQLWTALLPVIWGVHFWYCFVHCGEFTLYPSLEALVATDLLFFRTPRESFRRVGVSQKFHDFSRLRARDAPLPSPAKAANGHATTTTTSTTTTSTIGEGYPTAFLPRLKWVFDLIFATALGRLDESLRPSDFTPSTTPTGHPVRRWRARYFLKELGLCILTYLVIDAALFYSQYDAYLRQRPGATIDSPLPPFLTPYLAHSHGLVTPRSFRVALNGIAIIAIIERTWCVLDTVTSALVGLRVLGEEWNGESFEQPRFGSPRALVDSGLRGYWGSFWHQTLRGIFQTPPQTLTRFLSLPPTSLLSSTIQLVYAFLLSGLYHWILTPPSWRTPSTVQIPLFFFSQLPFILLEKTCSALLSHYSPKQTRSRALKIGLGVLRPLFAWGSLLVTVPGLSDALVEMRLWDRYARLQPASPCSWLLGQGWKGWSWGLGLQDRAEWGEGKAAGGGYRA